MVEWLNSNPDILGLNLSSAHWERKKKYMQPIIQSWLSCIQWLYKIYGVDAIAVPVWKSKTSNRMTSLAGSGLKMKEDLLNIWKVVTSISNNACTHLLYLEWICETNILKKGVNIKSESCKTWGTSVVERSRASVVGAGGLRFESRLGDLFS